MAPLTTNIQGFDILKSIRENIDDITPSLPSRAVITVGLYALEALESPSFQGDDMCSLIRVVHKKDMEHKSIALDPENSLVIDTQYEPHYWFDLQNYFEENDFNKELETTIFRYHQEILSIASMSEGSTSAILPRFHSYTNDQDKSTIALVVFPSMSHSSDALFNSFSSVGMLSLENSTPYILFDQEKLENFSGVHREGEIMTGNEIIEYVVSMFLEKRSFIRDVFKLSKSFNLYCYSMLLATGCSMEVYENFRNILDITLEQPLMDFDYKTAKLMYVLVRAPYHYRDELTKGQVEYEVSQWMKESLGIDIPQISELTYIQDMGDRIDVAILVGGFDTMNKYRDIYRRVERFADMNVGQGLYDTELWEKIKGKLLEY